MLRVVILVVVTALVGAGAWLLLRDDAREPVDFGVVDVVAPDRPDTVEGAPIDPAADASTPDARRLDVAPDVVDADETAAPDVDGPTAWIDGTVVADATDLPVAGVELFAQLQGASSPDDAPRATTDASGRYTIAVPLGSGAAELASVEVAAGSGHVQHRVHHRATLTDGARVTVDLRLPAAITARGTVVDLDDEPVAGATVRAWSFRPYAIHASLPTGTVTTDALGRFEFPGLAPTFTLEASADGYVSHERIESTRSAARDVDGITLRVSRAREIDGRVVDAGGRGVAGAELTVTVPGRAELTEVLDVFTTGVRPIRATSDADGGFTLRGVPERVMSVAVATDAYPEWRGEHAPGQPGMLIRLATGGALSGLLLEHDGTPAAGARVRFAKGPFHRNQRETTTGDDGRFRLLGLPTTDEGVLDVLADGQAARVVERLAISSEVDAVPLDVLLEREEVITGVVVDVDGAPVADARVSVVGDRVLDLDGATMFPLPTWENRVGVDRARTDADGRFALGNLYRGTFALRVADPDDDALVVTQDVGASARDLRVVLDPSTGGGVVLRGRVTDAFTGLPIPEFRVTPMAKQGEGGYGGSGTTVRDAEGRYVIPGIEPAEMIVSISADGYAPFSLPPTEYDAGEHVIDAALSPERELWLRIIDEQGTPRAGSLSFADDTGKPISVEVAPYSSSNFMEVGANGEAIVRGIPARPIEVRAQATGFGGPTTVTFDLTQPIVGWQDIVVREAVEQDVLVVVLRRGPAADGDVQLLPPTSSVTERLVEIVTKLADDELAAVPAPVDVTLVGPDGATLGSAPLEQAATSAVLADTSLVDDPIAVQVRVPVGGTTIRVDSGSGATSVPWDVTVDEAAVLGLAVIVL